MADKTVDVLAVLDEAQCDAENTYGHDSLQVVELNAARAAIEDLRLKADNAERALRSLVAAGQAPAGYLQYADDLAAALRAVGGAK